MFSVWQSHRLLGAALPKDVLGSGTQQPVAFVAPMWRTAGPSLPTARIPFA